MGPEDRETRLVRAFVGLADTLVDDYDVDEFLHLLSYRCEKLVGASAVGVLLTDDKGDLRLASASTDDMKALELFEMQNEEGPCYDAFRSGEQISVNDLEGHRGQWPRFTDRALGLGFQSVHAFPLRLRDEVFGALNVFFPRTGPFSDADILALQGLADVATIGVMQERSIRKAGEVVSQLQTALESRVVIERAVGVLVERFGVGTSEAFESMRSYARSNNQRVRAVAKAVVEGTLAADRLEPGALSGRRPRRG